MGNRQPLKSLISFGLQKDYCPLAGRLEQEASLEAEAQGGCSHVLDGNCEAGENINLGWNCGLKKQ